tara:strand:- start:4738 stop:4923 length:186 start_codon:yes stop_codon:yes gene_type:complete
MSDTGKKPELDRLKKVFRQASKDGKTSLKAGKAVMDKDPDKAALFTLLAGNIISSSKSQKR